MTVAWAPETSALVTGYHLYAGTQSGVYTDLIDAGTATSASISNLQPDTTYYFAVAAYGSAGLDSAPSNEVSFTTSPVASNQTVMLLSATTVIINVLAPGSPATDSVTQIGHPTNGVASINGDNTITYTPDSNYAGSDSFKYTVTNAGGVSATGTVSITSRASFTGLITNSSPTPANTGLIQIQTAGSGWFTGKLVLGALSTPISGEFGADGNAVVNIKTSDGTTIALNLSLNTATNQITGSMRTSADAPSSISATIITYSATNKAPQAGVYTVLLPSDPNPPATSTPPQGIGYCRLVVTLNGLARLTGILADNTMISLTASIASDGSLSIYQPLYSGGGYISGVLKFEDIITSGSQSDLDGVLAWVRPPSSDPNAVYPAGFSTAIDAAGSVYVPTPPSNWKLAEGLLRKGQTEAAVTFAGADLSSAVKDPVSLVAAGIFKEKKVGKNPLTVLINPASGVFSGSFVDPDTNKVRKFGGVLFQKRALGAGSFFSKTSSGSVVLNNGS